MGCFPSKRTAEVSEIIETVETDVAPPSGAVDTHVQGAFFGDEYNSYIRPAQEVIPQKSTVLSVITLGSVELYNQEPERASRSIRPYGIINRISSSRSNMLSLRCFTSWRISTLKSKDTLTRNLVNFAKTSLPELTQLNLK